jgi:hypothetical protein
MRGGTGRTIIVGDVHGCRAELEALLDRVAFSTGDELVFVGDLIARGPDSLGVLDIARRTGAVIVRGNHEEKLLAWRASRQGRPRSGKKREDEPLGRIHLEIAEALRPVDWSLLETSPLWYAMPDHDALVVHAGLVPGIPLDQQEFRTLLHIRALSPRGGASEDKSSPRLWGSFYEGPPHVIFGHNALPSPQFHPWATGIDTACVYGSRLTAMVLAQGEPVPRGELAARTLVSEPARRVYFDPIKKKELGGKKDVA